MMEEQPRVSKANKDELQAAPSPPHVHTPVSIFLNGVSVKLVSNTTGSDSKSGGNSSLTVVTIKQNRGELISEITATVPGGSLFAILGGSGSGKT